jgi:DNA ligase-1
VPTLTRTPLATLVETSARVSASASRIGKIRALAECLSTLAPDDIEIAVHYLSGELPQGRIGLGHRALQSAAAQQAAMVSQLQVHQVDALLESLRRTSGPGASAHRLRLLADLFSAATTDEQDFLLRLLAGELRQGAQDGVMIDAIAAAAGLPGNLVRRAAMYAPGLGRLAWHALASGEAGLRQFQLRVFDPIAPMLAQTAADVGEALQELALPVQFEWKMDGARIQVHKRGADVRIHTRGLNEMGAAIPEILALAQAFPVNEVVLDGEALGYTAAGRPQAFQVTMRRFGRRLNVASLLQELPMRAFYFDCLLLDGEVLADRPLRERLLALDRAVPADQRIPRLVTADEAGAARFYQAALDAGHEGLMAKSLDSVYEAGNRGANWLKIKRAHTLDLVVLAAEWGNGRRKGWLSNLHLGALDVASGEYVMLGKTFKGLTDEMLQWQTGELLARETGRDAITVYVRPELVVEIAFSDLQASPRYPGGLALRLARVKRYRTDKTAADADTMASVRRIHAAQG